MSINVTKFSGVDSRIIYYTSSLPIQSRRLERLSPASRSNTVYANALRVSVVEGLNPLIVANSRIYGAYEKLNSGRSPKLFFVKSNMRENGSELINRLGATFRLMPEDEYIAFNMKIVFDNHDGQATHMLIFDKKKAIETFLREHYSGFGLSWIGLGKFHSHLTLKTDPERAHIDLVFKDRSIKEKRGAMRELLYAILVDSFGGKKVTAHALDFSIIKWFSECFRGHILCGESFDKEDFNPSINNIDELATKLTLVGVLTAHECQYIVEKQHHHKLKDAYQCLEEILTARGRGVGCSSLQYLLWVIERFHIPYWGEFPLQGIIPLST